MTRLGKDTGQPESDFSDAQLYWEGGGSRFPPPDWLPGSLKCLRPKSEGEKKTKPPAPDSHHLLVVTPLLGQKEGAQTPPSGCQLYDRRTRQN